MFYEKFEAYLPKILLKKLPKIEANFTNLEVWCSKTELPKIEITNIEGYQYRGIPVEKTLCFDLLKPLALPRFKI